MKKTFQKSPRKTLEKGLSEFRQKVTLWGIEGGSIKTCMTHSEVLLRSDTGPQGGYDVIEEAWAKGFISSNAQAGTDLLDKILLELPEKCPECS